MGVKDILRTIQETSQQMIPLYAFPESAVRALNGMVRYAQMRQQPIEIPRVFTVRKEDASAIFEKAMSEGRRFLEPLECAGVLKAYGIPVPEMKQARGPEEAVQQAKQIGYPVVMKAMMRTRQHKSDFGGVALDLRNDTETIDAYRQIADRVKIAGLESDFRSVYLQPMMKGGKEVILGMTYDPKFGPLLMFGLGGIYVESMRDTTFRIIPIGENDAKTMIRSIKAFPLLQGVRGEQGVDLEFLAEMLQRLSQLASDFHFIREMEINPFIVSHRRDLSCAVDARIAIEIKNVMRKE
jgi:acetyltransferase